MEHIRIDPKFRRRPRTKRSGFKARETFLFLLQVSAEFDLHGRIPPAMWEMEWLVDEWTNGDNSSVALATGILCDGIEACIREGLLAVDGGVLVIVDWDEFYKPAKTNAERQAEHRGRVTKVTKPVTRNASNESNATIRHSTSHHTTPLNSTLEAEAPPPPISSVGAMGATVLAPDALRELADQRKPDSTGAPLRPEAELRAPLVYEKPTGPPEGWLGPEFFRWAQHVRQINGYVGEKWPPGHSLRDWFAEAIGTPGVTVPRLKKGFYAFGEDEHWKAAKPPYPFRAFMSQWASFMPQEVKHAAR